MIQLIMMETIFKELIDSMVYPDDFILINTGDYIEIKNSNRDFIITIHNNKLCLAMFKGLSEDTIESIKDTIDYVNSI